MNSSFHMAVVMWCVFLLPGSAFCLCPPLSMDNNDEIVPIYTCMENHHQFNSEGGVPPVTFFMPDPSRYTTKNHFNVVLSRSGELSGISNMGGLTNLVAADIWIGVDITATDSCMPTPQTTTRQFKFEGRYASDLLSFIGIPSEMNQSATMALPVTIVNNGYCVIPAGSKLLYQFVPAGSRYDYEGFVEGFTVPNDLNHNDQATMYADIHAPKAGLYVLYWAISYDDYIVYYDIVSNQVLVTSIMGGGYHNLTRVCRIVGCEGLNKNFDRYVNPSDRFSAAISKKSTKARKLLGIKKEALQLVRNSIKADTKGAKVIERKADRLLQRLHLLGF